MSTILNYCENSSLLRVLLILKNAFKIVCAIVPVILIVTTIYTIAKALITGKDEDLKGGGSHFIKKLIAALIVALLPTLVEVGVNMTDEDSFYEFRQCVARVTLDDVKYYEKVESIRDVFEDMISHPTQENINEAKKTLQEAQTFLREDEMIKYMTAIDTAEKELNESKLIAACQNKGGTYKDGYCYKNIFQCDNCEGQSGSGEDVTPSTGGPSTGGEGGGGVISGSAGYGTTELSILNENWTVINTPIGVKQFANAMVKNGVYQGSNSERYGGYCLGFSYTHAWGLYSGTTNYTGESGHGYVGASHFSTYISDDKQDVLSVIYNEITAGRPVILQVNGNKQGTSRHFVAVVGYKSSVTSGSSIQESDLLILDSWDANLERMDQSNSRFMTSGAMCHKDYSGWRIQYLK